MSHIFDALQRAEAERSGGNVSAVPDSVTELLALRESPLRPPRALPGGA